MVHRTTVLLTGFGAFPGVPCNATMLLVPRLQKLARQHFPGVVFVSEVLPTEWHVAPARVDTLLSIYRPDVVLHFGVSSRARGFEIETRAVNVCAIAPDAAGAYPDGDVIDHDGAAHIGALWPVGDILRRLRRRGIRAYASRDAGTYLCNRTLHHTLGVEALHPDLTRVGFVHVPAALVAGPGDAHVRHLRASAASPLSWEDALVGGLEIIGACLARPLRIDRRAVNRFA